MSCLPFLLALVCAKVMLSPDVVFTQGVHQKGVKEGKASTSKKNEPPAPTPAKREDVVFEVTDKTLQKVRPPYPTLSLGTTPSQYSLVLVRWLIFFSSDVIYSQTIPSIGIEFWMPLLGISCSMTNYSKHAVSLSLLSRMMGRFMLWARKGMSFFRVWVTEYPCHCNLFGASLTSDVR